jgi:putative endonuclease
MPNTRQQGRDWERVAESMLCRRGLRTLIRNYHCRFGEIDLIMLDGAVLVFVEVRYRHSDRYGSGADSVTPAKQRKVVSAARQFLGRHAGHSQRPSRFDVVSIGRGVDGIECNWIRSAFDAG